MKRIQTHEKTQDSGIYLDEIQQRKLINSLSRIEGHVASVKRMLDERKCADEMLIQIAAIKSALNGVAVRLVEHELKLCLTQCGADEANERFGRATRALTSMLKHS